MWGDGANPPGDGAVTTPLRPLDGRYNHPVALGSRLFAGAATPPSPRLFQRTGVNNGYY